MRIHAILVATAALLAGCAGGNGGGDPDTASPTQPTPTTATNVREGSGVNAPNPFARPTPTATPAATPTPTATPAATPTPTPTPTPEPSGEVDDAVSIASFAFSPREARVPAGTTVTWTNRDSAPHSVVADDGSFASGTLSQGGTFDHHFGAPGTYAYKCGIHASMRATVVVLAI